MTENIDVDIQIRSGWHWQALGLPMVLCFHPP